MQGIVLISVAMCLVPSLGWAQTPQRCKSPDLFTGGITVATQDEKVYAVGKYAYDAINQRIHLGEMGTYDHKNFTYEVLMLYKEGVMYMIHRHNQTCEKVALQSKFTPLEVPLDASFMSQVVLGTLAYPEQGLVVNVWTGQMPDNSGTYMMSFTELGCLPVSGFFQPKTNGHGMRSHSYFDNVLGVKDPDAFVPPPFCQSAKLKVNRDGKRADFFSVFQ
ncbi:ependymin-1-like [Alosa pseudoharengus]|uniref:ependymin-1-like n=1 Tax=Alosa pseudoharengus TaxID=34774 RepID=UPI003F895588